MKNGEFLNKPKSINSSINSIRPEKYTSWSPRVKSILKRRIRWIFLSFCKEHLRDCILLFFKSIIFVNEKKKKNSQLKTWNFIVYTCICLFLLPKYQSKRGGDLGWGKLFRFKCGIKNYLQIANVDLVNVWSQFNCNIDMIWNQAQVYI